VIRRDGFDALDDSEIRFTPVEIMRHRVSTGTTVPVSTMDRRSAARAPCSVTSRITSTCQPAPAMAVSDAASRRAARVRIEASPW
jgi:hypothetical protein